MDIIAKSAVPISLGRVGENEYTRVLFPVKKSLEELPGADITLYNTIPGDNSSYPVANAALDEAGEFYVWTVYDEDLGTRGKGECELTFTVNGRVKKSVIYDTEILRSLDGGGEAPSGWSSWQSVFNGIKADAQAAADAAEQSADDAASILEEAQGFESRVSPLHSTDLVRGAVADVVGIPEYVSNPATYAAYGITETGWYAFARITGREGTHVSAETTVTGAAGYIAETGADHVDVAVRFETAPMGQRVTVNWGEYADSYVFRATDLAVRNLDYRTTFYVYDIAPYTTWEYALTTDATFVANKAYYTLDNGVYTLAEVTAGEAVPADTYYTHSKVIFEGMPRNVTYSLDTPIDCPLEFKLPTIEDDGHGAWFEIQTRYTGSFSCTLTPPEGVKVGSTSTQSQTGGMNVIDLHYTNVNGYKMWTLLNTHTNLPTT